MTNPHDGHDGAVDVDSIRAELLARRRALFHEIEGVERDLASLEEPDDGERGELAQEEAFERLLDRLAEHEQRRFVEIQRALAKIAAGGYGQCERCGGAIEPERLGALPEARYCAECARVVEAEKARHGTPAADRPESRDPPIPADFSAMTDEEIASAVGEALRSQDGLGAIRAEVRNARVFLRGEVASATLASIAYEIVTDRLGLVTFDCLRIAREVGEQPETDARRPLPAEADDPRVRAALGTDDDTTMDVVEAEDQGTSYTPPDGPIPEPRKD